MHFTYFYQVWPQYILLFVEIWLCLTCSFNAGSYSLKLRANNWTVIHAGFDGKGKEIEREGKGLPWLNLQ